MAGGGEFQVHYNSNLDAGQATRLLEAVAQYMAIHSDNG
jgi:hypothetical protein